jgi:flagellar biosynthesis/type III secretory pathway chaperone
MDQLEEKLLILFQEKIALYRELAAVFEQEKACIITSDVTALWALSARKQALADDLRERRAALPAAVTAAGIPHGLDAATFTLAQLLAALPVDGGRALRPLAVQLLNLKDRIRALAAHNRRLLDDGLAMVADLIGTIVNLEGGARSGYGRCQSAGGFAKRTLFLHQEV